jgi:thioredoxin 1
VLGNPGLTVVDFNAVWCGPCKTLKPIFNKAANDFAGKASFATIDVDENPVVSELYRVSSIPLLLFFKGGKQVHSIVGLVDAKTLNAAINKAL